jgi:DNA-cytosine methyltransferase
LFYSSCADVTPESRCVQARLSDEPVPRDRPGGLALTPAVAVRERASSGPYAQPGPNAHAAFRKLWIIEDNAQTKGRQGVPGVVSQRRRILVQIHAVHLGEPQLAALADYRPGELTSIGRAGLALDLLDEGRARSGVVIAGTNYGSNRNFIPGVLDRGMHVAVEIHRDSGWGIDNTYLPVRADQLLDSQAWTTVHVVNPETDGDTARFLVKELGQVRRGDDELRAFAFAPGSVVDPDGDLRIGVTSLLEAPIHDIVQCVGWARWIRTLNRRRLRDDWDGDGLGDVTPNVRRPLVTGNSRPNIRLAIQQDRRRLPLESKLVVRESPQLATRPLKLMELFAGAGGLGLGFLLASGAREHYRIVYSAEVDPIYAQTLKHNHKHVANAIAPVLVPSAIEPLDLRRQRTETVLLHAAKAAGGIDVLIGGPPCQGFSNANRNSWSSKNPNNRLVDVFLRYVRQLQPRLVLLENVQGILWTDRQDSVTGLSVADHIVGSLKRSGYWAFPKLLDAVWYGVPQHRARFFLLAVHEDTGYRRDDFGDWGPFPAPSHGPSTDRPYTTVQQAIGDLPVIGNGASEDILPYSAPSATLLAQRPYLAWLREGAKPDEITDHVTSRHADYVLERYKRIPQGGNWQNITELMTNYTAVDRTHSNIYRRLRCDEPAVTIGHYRKSMIVHPTQNRGLSLREAARIQSFPDWFRFAGADDERPGGLMHKQQQLANAVSPLVAKAIAEFLLTL